MPLHKYCLYKNVFKRIFDKLSNGMQVDRLCTCGSQVIKICRIIVVTKIKFSNISSTEIVNKK